MRHEEIYMKLCNMYPPDTWRRVDITNKAVRQTWAFIIIRLVAKILYHFEE